MLNVCTCCPPDSVDAPSASVVCRVDLVRDVWASEGLHAVTDSLAKRWAAESPLADSWTTSSSSGRLGGRCALVTCGRRGVLVAFAGGGLVSVVDFLGILVGVGASAAVSSSAVVSRRRLCPCRRVTHWAHRWIRGVGAVSPVGRGPIAARRGAYRSSTGCTRASEDVPRETGRRRSVDVDEPEGLA